jgi:hypothetical protein
LFHYQRGARNSIKCGLAVYVISVGNAVDGLELSGNAVAISTRCIVTAFHNVYDKVDATATNTFDNSYYDGPDDKFIKVYNYAVITQKVLRQPDNTESYENPIVVKLVKFLDGDYAEDWAIFEIQSDITSFLGLLINPAPSDFIYLEVCPESSLPQVGEENLRGYHFDIALFKRTSHYEEVLKCQRVPYSRVTMYKRISRMFRMQGALSSGSCGSPSVNGNGQLVGIHIASLDSCAVRGPLIRFRGISDVSSIADTYYNAYKESSVLCKSKKFIRLKQNLL